MRHFIGVDIGGTSIKYGLVNEDLTVEKDGSCKTPDAGKGFWRRSVSMLKGF